jgi:hypothetical protein
MTIRHGKWFPPNWIGPVLPFQPVSRAASLGGIDAADAKNLFTLKKQAAARGYARVKKVSFAT